MDRIISNSQYNNLNKNNYYGKDLVVYEELESLVILKLLSKNKYFIDIGAHQGYYSYIASSFCYKVFAFEPLKKFYNEINFHIKINNLNNINVYNYGLGNGNVIKYGNFLEIRKIKTKTLDNFIKENNLNEKILIKIDIDGFEIDLFEGFSEQINPYNHSIVVDVYPERIDKEKLIYHIYKLLEIYQNDCYFIDKKLFKKNHMLDKEVFKKIDIDTLLQIKNNKISTLVFGKI